MSALVCVNCGFGNDDDSTWALGFDWEESICRSCQEDPDWVTDDADEEPAAAVDIPMCLGYEQEDPT